MIKEFTPAQIMTNRGCYLREQVEVLSEILIEFVNNK